jgi:hypothetical protein
VLLPFAKAGAPESARTSAVLTRLLKNLFIGLPFRLLSSLPIEPFGSIRGSCAGSPRPCDIENFASHSGIPDVTFWNLAAPYGKSKRGTE